MNPKLVCLAFASILATAACGGNNEEVKAPETPPPADMPAPTPAMTESAAMTSPPASTTPPEPAKPTLTDADIGAITSAANNGEIEVAKVATKNCQNAQVKSYANMMIKEHTDAEAKGKKVLASANVTPSDNEISSKLKSEVDSTVSSLKSTKGAECDKAYMDSQVKMHTEVLSTIDDKLIPSAKNPDLKTLLGDVRTHVATHLAKAQEINQSLTSGKTSAAPPAKK